MLIMLYEVQVHNFDFECKHLFYIMRSNAKVMKQFITWELDAFRCYDDDDVDNYKCVFALVSQTGANISNHSFIGLTNF